MHDSLDPAPPVDDIGATSFVIPGNIRRRSFVFLGGLTTLAFLSDVLSKVWAEERLSRLTTNGGELVLVKGHVSLLLTYNLAGAWGLLQSASEGVRRPFFVLVSIVAVVFIVTIYSRLRPEQRALRWGLPLVLGGALGNLVDRIFRRGVIDFISYQASWVEAMNSAIHRVQPSWFVTDHWPVFNVADVWICVGVGLMAIDAMRSSRRPRPAQ